MSAEDLRRILDAIVEKAPKLREAGVTAVRVNGIEFRVQALPGAEESTPEELAEERRRLDRAMQQADGPAQHDPATFGLGPEDDVPGYKRRPERRS